MCKMNRRLLLLLVLPITVSAELPDKAANKHMGVATCATSQCHGSAVPRDGANVMQNEYVTWTQDDPHSKAYEVLNNAQSTAIAARLGLRAAHTAGICQDHDECSVVDERLAWPGVTVPRQSSPLHGLHRSMTGMAIVERELGKHAIAKNLSVDDQSQALSPFFE